jgi:hypothetical protein
MQDNNKKINFLSKLSFRKNFYPLVSLVFALIIVLIFFFSVKFIAESIDRAFYEPSESEIASQVVLFDKANYIIVAKKLGIGVEEKKPENIVNPATPFPNIPIGLQPELMPKNFIKIAIYNSTQTAGLAAKLKAVLVGGGFEVAETSTLSPALETTTIKTKDGFSTSPFIEEIKTLVSSKYQIVSTTLPSTSTFDVEIIIGRK